MSKHVLLTGASGFIGHHTLEYLLQTTDWTFTCPCSWRHKGTPERLTEILTPEFQRRVRIITHDLTAPFTETTKRDIGAVDYIINVASESHVDRSIADPAPFIENNVKLVVNLLEYAREVEPTLFIQVSTDEVYGSAPDGVRFQEWGEILPSNPYAASKAAQEAIAISYWRTYGVPIVITNTVNNFGERQDTEKYLARLIRMIANDETVTVHGSEEYVGGRFYLHAKNHAHAFLHIIENDLYVPFETDRDFPARFNVTSDDELDNVTVAKMVADIMGKPLKYELTDYHATRPGHDRRYGLDGTSLSESGFSLKFPLPESLQRYVLWTLDHPRWM